MRDRTEKKGWFSVQETTRLYVYIHLLMRTVKNNET